MVVMVRGWDSGGGFNSGDGDNNCGDSMYSIYLVVVVVVVVWC